MLIVDVNVSWHRKQAFMSYIRQHEAKHVPNLVLLKGLLVTWQSQLLRPDQASAFCTDEKNTPFIHLELMQKILPTGFCDLVLAGRSSHWPIITYTSYEDVEL